MTPAFNLIQGDCLTELKRLETESVQTCVTSPPYWGLRDYGIAGQLGLEKTPEEYVAKMVEVFREVRRVLKPDGTLWLNLGDSYAGSWGNQGRKETRGGQRPVNAPMMQKVHDGRYPTTGTETGSLSRTPGLKAKDLVGIPWRVAFALQADGWYLRQDIIWHKPNPMPESVRDRCTKAHEYIFLFAKSERYYFDNKALQEPAARPEGSGNKRGYAIANERPGSNSNLGSSLHKIGPRDTRNRRSVWTVTTKPFKGAHFATFPPDLIEPCILAGSKADDVVLDPFNGAGTTGLVSQRHGRRYVGIEMNPDYVEITRKRIFTEMPLFEKQVSI